ncbi:ABC-2 type transport system ATP-binding protein [Prauserella shujinwangii]|uniref:ABC-2 type transport system ATP-binding protein n=1 Tax=Prauserella shujinwangii TaxID=1453103 RepID=A0A2T0M0K8_9PSEU|nr:ABC transporter ATP-binding protein [Prauserella shujinwangii]PRX50143.1 ABC-2 type transport system ATP-binding protein [Prauserella shujinwangii]
MSVVRMRNVTKHYGRTAALSGITLDLAEHRIHGLLGRNGAGKTTIMQILTGQNFETSGEVEVFGQHPYENTDVLGKVCFIRESQKYPDIFAARHAFAAAELLYPNWDTDFAAELADEFALPLNRRIKKLSRGQLSAVGVIIGLAARAPLTFFDEPYLGLDAVARRLFYDRLLTDFAEHPRTIVLSTHLIDEVSDLIEDVVLIDRGKLLLDEDAETLRSRAVTVTGPVSAVEAFARHHRELHREQLGGLLRVTLEGPRPESDVDGLQVEPVSLQELVVRTTQQARERELVGTTNGKGER